MLAFLRRSVDDLGQSIVMVTHDPRGAAYADRVLFLADGKVVDELDGADGGPGAGPDAGTRGPEMRKVTIKGLLAHKLRLALTALAIVLGVTFISGTFVLTDTLHNTFTTLFGNIYQKIDFEVRGGGPVLRTTAPDAVRNPMPEVGPAAPCARVPGVEAAYGSRRGLCPVRRPRRPAISTGGAPTLGVVFDPDPQISELHIVQGGHADHGR